MSNKIDIEHLFNTCHFTDYELEFYNTRYIDLNKDEQKIYDECIEYYCNNIIYRKLSNFGLSHLNTKLFSLSDMINLLRELRYDK